MKYTNRDIFYFAYVYFTVYLALRRTALSPLCLDFCDFYLALARYLHGAAGVIGRANANLFIIVDIIVLLSFDSREAHLNVTF